MSLLELDSVEVVYQRRGRAPVPAVVGASLRVEPGEIVGLVGESGCGKSSLARAAVGLTPLEGGGVTFEGRPLSPLTRRARSAVDTRLQLVFQNPFASLNPRRRVGAQIDDAATISRRGEASSRRARVDEVLRLVDLPADAARRYPRQFSGGQRQRVAIARALAAEPSLLVLDEPFASLDASAQAQLANLLVRLTADLGLGLLLISHDLAIVRGIASRVYVMYLGKVVEHASTAALWDEPLHPYTEALIAAMPRADGSGFMPDALAGEVPDPSLPPSGCRFHPRCPAAFEPCDSEVPPLERVGGDREVACWLRIPAGGTQDGPASTRSAGRGARTGSG